VKARLLKDIRDPTGETDESIPAGTIVNVVEVTAETKDGTCFPLEVEHVEILPPTFEDLGLEIWGMGAGNAAYGLNLANGDHILVTEATGCWIPQDDGPVLVGIYDGNREAKSVMEYPTPESAVRVLINDLGLVPVMA
jgi:hypothetical protein